MIPISKHHLLWTRKDFNKGYAHKLRKALAYNIPDEVHKSLHRALAPIPPITEPQARELYASYRRAPDLNIFDALEWLIDNAPTQEFQVAMMNQSLFLRCYL